MSFTLLIRAIEDGPPDPLEALVLIVLANECRKGATSCWPGLALIARKARLSERGAQLVLRRLEADGWIKITIRHGRGRTNTYEVLPAKGERGDTFSATGKGERDDPFSAADEAPEKVNGATGKGERGDAKTRTPRHEKVNVTTKKHARTSRQATGNVSENSVQESAEPEYEPEKEPEKSAGESRAQAHARARGSSPVSLSGPSPRRRRPKVPIPDTFPTQEDRQAARDLGFSDEESEHEARKFRDWHLAHGTEFADWTATWRNWLNRAPEFAARQHQAAGGRTPGGLVGAALRARAARAAGRFSGG